LLEVRECISEQLFFPTLRSFGVLLTSKLKRTPPIGEPKATEIPAAAAAENTSRFRAIHQLANIGRAERLAGRLPTLVLVDVLEGLDKHVRNAACDMHQGAFLPQPHP
jgi:hypothetical protein